MISWLRAVWHDIVLKHHVTHVESPWPHPNGFLVGHCTCGGVITIRRRTDEEFDELVDPPHHNWAINADKVTCPGLRHRIRRILRERETLTQALPTARLL